MKERTKSELIELVRLLADVLDDAYAELCCLECDGPIALLKTQMEDALVKSGRSPFAGGRE